MQHRYIHQTTSSRCVCSGLYICRYEKQKQNQQTKQLIFHSELYQKRPLFSHQTLQSYVKGTSSTTAPTHALPLNVRAIVDRMVAKNPADRPSVRYSNCRVESFCLLFSSLLLSYLVMSCLVMSCLILFCLVLSRLVTSCLVLFLVLFCFVLFCFVLFCFVLFCFVLFCFVLFCFVLFCFVLFCFVLFRLVSSCFIIVFECIFPFNLMFLKQASARRGHLPALFWNDVQFPCYILRVTHMA